ncbi:MAG TPA: hypothetical protein VJI33_01340 [Candidatus Paceibacterota bacterium]
MKRYALLFSSLIIAVAAVLGAVPAWAEYQIPEVEAQRLAGLMLSGKMDAMTLTPAGPIVWVGKTYEAGVAAGFGVTGEGNPAWHLEEWEDVGVSPSGAELFRVTMYWFRPEGVRKGVYLFRGNIRETFSEEDLGVVSGEAIAKSELAQQILRKAGGQDI